MNENLIRFIVLIVFLVGMLLVIYTLEEFISRKLK